MKFKHLTDSTRQGTHLSQLGTSDTSLLLANWRMTRLHFFDAVMGLLNSYIPYRLSLQHMHTFQATSIDTKAQVGFIYTFWYSLLSTSSILEQGFQSIHYLQMTSSEGFQQHLSIISKFVCCGFYMKNHVAFSHIPFAVLK